MLFLLLERLLNETIKNVYEKKNSSAVLVFKVEWNVIVSHMSKMR